MSPSEQNRTFIYELRADVSAENSQKVYQTLEPELTTRRYAVLDMRNVQSVDGAGVQMFEQVEALMARRGAYLLFCNIQPSVLSNEEALQYFNRLALVHAGSSAEVFTGLGEALEWIEQRMLIDAGQAASDDRPLELRDIDLFEGRREDTLAALQDCIELRSCKAGERIFSQGDRGDELFLIRRGSVRILLPLGEGRQRHLATFGRGDFFGEMAFIDNAPRSADAVAFMDTDLFVMSRVRFDGFAQHHFKTANALTEALAKAMTARLRHTNTELGRAER